MTDYEDFFKTLTGYAPYQYQCRLACGAEQAGSAWLEGGVGWCGLTNEYVGNKMVF